MEECGNQGVGVQASSPVKKCRVQCIGGETLCLTGLGCPFSVGVLFLEPGGRLSPEGQPVPSLVPQSRVWGWIRESQVLSGSFALARTVGTVGTALELAKRLAEGC